MKTGRECDLGRERRAGGAGAGRRAVSGSSSSSSSSISSKFMYDTVGRRRQTHSLSSCMSETHMPFPASRYGTASALRSASQTPCTPSRREWMPYHLYDLSVFSGRIRRTARAYWTCVRACVCALRPVYRHDLPHGDQTPLSKLPGVILEKRRERE